MSVSKSFSEGYKNSTLDWGILTVPYAVAPKGAKFSSDYKITIDCIHSFAGVIFDIKHIRVSEIGMHYCIRRTMGRWCPQSMSTHYRDQAVRLMFLDSITVSELSI